MQDTSITLLTKEGGVRATFRPALSSDQYAALAEAIKHDGDTIAAMRDLLTMLARSWGCTAIIEPC
jgi:hypothetical protein